ncbi:MAG TPA: glycosyltransferase family 9 protein [Thermomicrobiales bacterium]|nr:glycosyltransferase family 9 protein [Thermomicrobiales bacterium]
MNQRILVVKLADLGDLLLCEPAIRSLRAANPDAQIDILVPPETASLAMLLGHGLCPLVFEKKRFDRAQDLAQSENLRAMASLWRTLRQRQYDAIILLHHLTTVAGTRKFRALALAARAPVVAGLDNGRGTFLTHRADDFGFGARHECEYMLSVSMSAGGTAVHPAPAFPVESCEHGPPLPERFAAIHPVTGPYSQARTWPIERWADVARGIARAGLVPVVVGAPDATGAARAIVAREPAAIDITGSTTIPQLAGVLRRAACVLGGDSFVGHLAAAVGTPTASVFGPSNADAWRPYGSRERHRVVMSQLPCQPCIYTGFSLGRPMGCPDRTCLRWVTVDDVLARLPLVAGAD